MNNLLIGLLSAVISTNPPAAVSNMVEAKTGISVPIARPTDPIEQEYQKIMAQDDDAQAEIDEWIRNAAPNSSIDPRVTLKLRIERRLEPVRKAYQDFIERHPNHAGARLAYGSFLNDLHDEEGAAQQWEKARELDPKNPAAWNNLANYYGHRSPVKKSFEYYAKAIELNPNEPVYYQNFATTVYLFRKDAQEFYGISEKEVFDKALDLYCKAMKLDPNNFVLATDYAQSFYGTKPPRWADGLVAWEQTLKLARDEIEREGVYIHLARIKWKLGRLQEARKDLEQVTNQMYTVTKQRLLKNIDQAANPASTNALPAPATKTNAPAK